jgi:PPK2 family polyphosphate:nucleotide phosphotransferase
VDYKNFMVAPGNKVTLDDFDPGSTGSFKSKQGAQAKLAKDIERMAELQDVLYASCEYALLVIFQAMDTAGKDGAIKHVMSGVNPQGVQVVSFKQPSQEELHHDYLWRAAKALPPRGYIGIFNRSYYEEVLVARVHTEILQGEKVSAKETLKDLWKERYEDINNFELHLTRNGTQILKFFLNLSREEQRQRLLARLEDPSKNWKFSSADLHERSFWDQYADAYEKMLCHTSTKYAPWYVVPADHKWFTRVLVADVIVAKLKSLKLKYPEVPKLMKPQLLKAQKALARAAAAGG